MVELNDLLVVIVLYRQQLSESISFKSLMQCATDCNSGIDLYIYDNSPIDFVQEDIKLYQNKIKIQYIRDISNIGIGKAYNEGYIYAESIRKNWILLLDQDSLLPNSYCSIFFDTLSKYYSNDIVAYVPKIEVKGKIISPAKISNSGFLTFLDNKHLEKGIKFNISALNSGTIISTCFLKEIGGFSEHYPLDMLDHWLYKKIVMLKKTIVLMPITIQHNLSVMSGYTLDRKRLISILNAEKNFVNEFGNILDIFFYKLRLLGRCIKYFINFENLHTLICLKYIFK